MAANGTCDGCGEDVDGARVTVATEATDERGINVEVTKRWVLCRPCAESVFARIGEPSPWVDDFKTVVLPDQQLLTPQVGGYLIGYRAHVP